MRIAPPPRRRHSRPAGQGQVKWAAVVWCTSKVLSLEDEDGRWNLCSIHFCSDVIWSHASSRINPNLGMSSDSAVSAQHLHMAGHKRAALQCRRRVLEQNGTNICFGTQIDSKKKSETICGFWAPWRRAAVYLSCPILSRNTSCGCL